jgi:PAS domain S-box-containing protein
MSSHIAISSIVCENLLNNLPGMFYRCNVDENWTMTYVSSGCLKLTGFEIDELLNNRVVSFADLIHPEDKDWLWEECVKNLENKIPCNHEFRIICRQGRVRWVKEMANGIYNDKGVLLYIEGYIQEITAEKEKHLLTNAFASFQTAINSSSIVSITDTNGNIIYANDLFCQASQYSRRELTGQNHRIINSGYHSKAFFEELWSTIVSGRTWRGEIRNKAKDGTLYWVDTVISPVFNEQGEIYQYLSIRNIITHKKEFEDALQKSETLLKEAQRIGKFGNWHYLHHNKTLNWSEEVFGIFGVKQKIGLNLNEIFKSSIHPDDREKVDRIYEESIANHKPYDVIHRIVLKNGKIKYLQEHCETQYDESGNPVISIGTVHDITQLKETETALKRMQSFRDLLLNIGSRFIGFHPEQLDDLLNSVLKDTGIYFGADRSYIFLMDYHTKTASNTHEWCKEGIKPEIENQQNIPFEVVPAWLEELEKDRFIHIEDVGKLSGDWESVKEILEAQDVKSLIVIPVKSQSNHFNNGLWGFVGYDSVVEYKSWKKEEIDLLRVLANNIASAFERKHTDMLITKVSIESEEEERSRLARDIHDGIGQSLAALNMYINLLGKKMGDIKNEYQSLFLSIKELLIETIDETRKVSHDLMPAEIKEFSLYENINSLISKLNKFDEIKFSVSLKGKEKDLDPLIKINIYRIAQEFIKNSQKYAEANQVKIKLVYSETELHINISDDGKGFDMEANKNNGLGLLNMTHRINYLGGKHEFITAPGKGVHLKILIPIK